MKVNKYEHIFFDLDRTIWDFDANTKKVLIDIYNDFNLKECINTSNDFVINYHNSNEELWIAYKAGKIKKEEVRAKRFKKVLEYFNNNDIKLAQNIENYFINNFPRQTILLPYAEDILTYLFENYKLHIITNGFEENQLIKLESSKISRFFDQVVFSERVGVRKPHPFIFKRAFQAAKAKCNNSLMVGDDWYADIYGAQRVKMDSIYFNPHEEPHEHKVTTEISCLSELYELL